MTSRHAIITHQTVLANPRINFFLIQSLRFWRQLCKITLFCCYFV